jgi:hypothetical protein
MPVASFRSLEGGVFYLDETGGLVPAAGVDEDPPSYASEEVTPSDVQEPADDNPTT